jgi:hypothetical protein
MARGGYRPRSGPMKGTKYKKGNTAAVEVIDTKNLPPLPDDPILPLDYMLRVLNDPKAHVDRRDRMAALAAPFCHVRAGEKGGKKLERANAAKEAATGRFGSRPAPHILPMKKQG